MAHVLASWGSLGGAAEAQRAANRESEDAGLEYAEPRRLATKKSICLIFFSWESFPLRRLDLEQRSITRFVDETPYGDWYARTKNNYFGWFLGRSVKVNAYLMVWPMCDHSGFG